ncbi:hypothetical protein MYP_2761 [Sporocytophaga myxococcoides]|uniref:Lipoprotein n=1 Tax=Sporocytophaga myxococcoides TaxID=153721 RepID=A0A098LGG7_9BACT|nr:hypothetical protein [Sporocytophaga myxococcoides]GAL85532.1 hypothetical protein MYP_2761 [Sporocytophaga myxococcoides]
MNSFKAITFVLFFIANVFIFILSSCIDGQDKDDYEVLAEKPCPPSLNIDSLKIVLRKQIREEQNRFVFNSSYPDEGGNKSNYIFAEKTYIYSEPDSNSTILTELPFCSEVQRIEGIKNLESQGEWWTTVMHPDDVNKLGYVRYQDFADFMYIQYDKGYGFLVGQSDTLIDQYNQRTVELRRFSINNHKILERYKTSYRESGFRFFKVYNTTLNAGKQRDNYNELFVYETYRLSCPGGGMKEFILDDGNKLIKVAAVKSEGEGGYYNQEVAYIPLKFHNGKVLLVADADVQNIFSSAKAELNVFPYVSEYNIPVEDMVVIQYESNGYDDPNLDFDIDESENAKVTTICTLYKWDGNKLIKVKELQ